MVGKSLGASAGKILGFALGSIAGQSGTTFSRTASAPYYPWDWESPYEVETGVFVSTGFTITENDDGTFSCSYDAADDAPTGLDAAYLSQENGDNATAALNNPALPYLTTAAAISAGAAHLITQDGEFALSSATTTSLMITQAVGASQTYFRNRIATPATWTQQSAPNGNVYLATGVTDTISNILDATNNVLLPLAEPMTQADGSTGVPIPADLETSIATVQGNANSFWQDGTNLYYHAKDGLAPVTDNLVLLDDTPLINTTANDIVIFIDGPEFWGSTPFAWNAGTTGEQSLFVASNCGFRYATGSDDVLDIDDVHTRFTNVKASHCRENDIFSYHKNVAAAWTTTHLEYNCEGSYAGYQGAGNNDNGSTTHDRIYAIRVGGRYFQNAGPAIADTAGSHVINLGCNAFDSYIGIQSGTYSTIYPAVVYCKGCALSGNSNSDFDRSTGGQLIDLGDNTYSTANGTIIDGTDPFWLTLTTIAPSKIVGIYSVDKSDFFDNQSSQVDDLFDVSPNKNNGTTANAHTTVLNPDYTASNADANDMPTFTWAIDGTKHSNYFDLAKSATFQDVIFIGQYKDGLDSAFDDYNSVVTGSASGDQPRVIGNISTANILSSNQFATTVSVNGDAASATMLPAPFGIYRFTDTAANTDSFDLLGGTAYTNRGWVGATAVMIASNETLMPGEFIPVLEAAAEKYGVVLPDNLLRLFPDAQIDFSASDYTSGNWVDRISGVQLELIGDPTHDTDKFDLDGSDGFRGTSLWTPDAYEDLAKTTGGAVSTITLSIRTPDSWAGTQYILSNTTFAAGTAGFDLRVNAAGAMTFVQANVASVDTVAIGTLATGTDYIISIAVDTANGTFKASINGESYTDLSSLYAPVTNTTTPTNELRLCVNAGEGGANFLGNGSEIKQLSFINKILSDADLVNLVAEYNSR